MHGIHFCQAAQQLPGNDVSQPLLLMRTHWAMSCAWQRAHGLSHM